MSRNSRIRMKDAQVRQQLTDDQIAKLTFGDAICRCCGGPPVMAIRSYSLLSEFMQKEPELCAAIGTINGGTLPTVKMKWGEMVRISEVFACRNCRKDAEKAAAKSPDWAFVEIDNSLPNVNKKVISQVPAAYRNQ